MVLCFVPKLVHCDLNLELVVVLNQKFLWAIFPILEQLGTPNLVHEYGMVVSRKNLLHFDLY